MYLFPTKEDLDALWREISPRERFLRAARQAVDYACSPDGDSMAAFFLDSQDIDIHEEAGKMTYPRGLRANCGIIDDYSGFHENFFGTTHEGPGLEKLSSWEEI